MLAAVLGPTASGKSAVAMELARRVGAEIVSVDSMQVYRGMDIGTAKPTQDERAEVVHHMIDVADPAEEYSVAEFRIAALSAVDDSTEPLLVVGGSGLHFRAVVDPLDFEPSDDGVRGAVEQAEAPDLVEELLEADPDAGDLVDLSNRRRVERAVEIHRITGRTPSQRAATDRAAAVRRYEPEREFVAVGIDPEDALPVRVERRFDRMIASGLEAEVERLLPTWGRTASQAAGYREMARVVSGEWDLETGRHRAIGATTSLARRQRTFFRRDPRIRWLEWEDDAGRLADLALRVFEEAGWTS